MNKVENGHLPENIPCFNCGKKTLLKSAFNHLYCRNCWLTFACAGVPMAHSFKCGIPGCSNRTDQGNFVGDFCVPCHAYVVGKTLGSEFNSSQAYHNEIVKSNLRLISEAEGERREVNLHLPKNLSHDLGAMRVFMLAVARRNAAMLASSYK